MKRNLGLGIVETAATIAWFAMDACWMLDSRFLALTLAFPTLLLSLLVFRFVRRTPSSWLVTGAMTSWAIMNVLWMTYDFELIGWGLVAGKAFLLLGLLLVSGALVTGGNEGLRTLTTRFRRLRLRA